MSEIAGFFCTSVRPLSFEARVFHKYPARWKQSGLSQAVCIVRLKKSQMRETGLTATIPPLRTKDTKVIFTGIGEIDV